jgi:XTP/dITP diphosphohydrolase
MQIILYLCSMKLVFATNNAHKLDEVRRILPADVEVLSLEQVGFLHDIDETGTTLAENSRIKAETVAEWLRANSQQPVDGVFADDTGLEIDALGGKPGVYTARWAGEPAANRRKALQELADKPNRAAQFRTVVTLIDRTGTRQVDGIVRGRIATEERGDGGFGYDPVFIPEGYDKTFAELPAETKNTISHRARAMSELKKLLQLT